MSETESNVKQDEDDHRDQSLALRLHGDDAASLEQNDINFTEAFVNSMTPRSNEALRQLGVLPAELIVLPFEAFFEQGVNKEIQKLRYQSYEQQRQDVVAKARAQRNRLMRSGWTPLPPGSTPQPKMVSPMASHRTSHRSMRSNNPLAKSQPQMDIAARIAAEEEAQIQKMLRRQQRELEIMMQNEIRVAEMHEQELARQKHRKELEQQREEEKKKRHLELQLKNQAFEEKKAKEEEEAREIARIHAEEYAKQQKEFEADRQRKREKQAIEARKRTLLRIMKKKELQERNKKIEVHHHRMMAEKLKIMKQRDIQRHKALMEAKLQLQERHAAEAAEARERMARVVEEQKKEVVEKQVQLQQKMQSQEERLKELEKKREEEIEYHRRVFAEKEIRRRRARERAKIKEIAVKQEILKKAKRHQRQIQEVEQHRNEEEMVRHELRRLNRERKLANMERVRRMEEYRRQALLEKVQTDMMRGRMLEIQREETKKRRQEAQMLAAIHREEVIRQIDRMRLTKNWGEFESMGDENMDDTTREMPTKTNKQTMSLPALPSKKSATSKPRSRTGSAQKLNATERPATKRRNEDNLAATHSGTGVSGKDVGKTPAS